VPAISSTITIAGQIFAVNLKRHGSTRRLSLRMGRDGQSLNIVAPPRISIRQIMTFVQTQEEWVITQINRQPTPNILAPNSFVPLYDQLHQIISLPDQRRGIVTIKEAKILVPGDPTHLVRRVRDAIIREAGISCRHIAEQKTTRLHRPTAPITLRDTKSRWGSCNANGRLSFSWRLVMAPLQVLDYVVAHEVAHLVHLNHGPDFWALCQSLCDHDMASSRRWLRQKGHSLFQFF